jgi:hypothetical protein
MGLAFWRAYHEEQRRLAEGGEERSESPVEALRNIIEPEAPASDPEPEEAAEAPEKPVSTEALPTPRVTRAVIAQRRASESKE